MQTVVTKRADTVPETVVAETPISTPTDVKIVAMHWARIVGIRGLRMYLQTVIGLLTAAGLGADGGMMPNDFMPLLQAVLQLALAPLLMSLLQNSLELLSKVDVNYPQMRA